MDKFLCLFVILVQSILLTFGSLCGEHVSFDDCYNNFNSLESALFRQRRQLLGADSADTIKQLKFTFTADEKLLFSDLTNYCPDTLKELESEFNNIMTKHENFMAQPHSEEYRFPDYDDKYVTQSENDSTTNPKIKTIVLTGGPGGGKTTFTKILEEYKTQYKKDSKLILIAPEAATIVLSRLNFKFGIDDLTDTDLQITLNAFQIIIEKSYKNCVQNIESFNMAYIFYDRAIIDAAAYIKSYKQFHRDDIKDISDYYNILFKQTNLYQRYNIILHIESSAIAIDKTFAPLEKKREEWRKIQQENPARWETFVQAYNTDQSLALVWEKYATESTKGFSQFISIQSKEYSEQGFEHKIELFQEKVKQILQ